MTSLEAIRDGWNHAAREDALFNIITDPAYRGGSWPEGEFFAHGQREIDALIEHLDGLGLRGPRRRRALDFGCGVGRLTQALAGEYARVIGVDISVEMIERARGYNRHGTRCSYQVNDAADLGGLESKRFDLIYSRITLQHIPADLQRGYVHEFVRVLAPQGLASFQIPEGPEYHHPDAWLSMYGVPRSTVEGWVAETSGQLVDVEQLEDASPTWIAWRYTVRR